MDRLNEGINLPQVDYTFFRHEKSGVYRLGQTEVEYAHETRLYVYMDEEKKIVYILGIGDKNNQDAQVNDHAKTVNDLKKRG